VGGADTHEPAVRLGQFEALWGDLLHLLLVELIEVLIANPLAALGVVALADQEHPKSVLALTEKPVLRVQNGYRSWDLNRGPKLRAETRQD
jgi:hypothetical protein